MHLQLVMESVYSFPCSSPGSREREREGKGEGERQRKRWSKTLEDTRYALDTDLCYHIKVILCLFFAFLFCLHIIIAK